MLTINEKLKEFANENNDELRMTNRSICKNYIYYDIPNDRLDVGYISNHVPMGVVVFSSVEVAYKAIDEFYDELIEYYKELFGEYGYTVNRK